MKRTTTFIMVCSTDVSNLTLALETRRQMVNPEKMETAPM
jgi:hypothetical protein